MVLVADWVSLELGIAFSRLKGFGLGRRGGSRSGGGLSSSASPFRDPSGVQGSWSAVFGVGDWGLDWGGGGVLGAGDDSNPN